jgi:hypothetical protein
VPRACLERCPEVAPGDLQAGTFRSAPPRRPVGAHFSRSRRVITRKHAVSLGFSARCPTYRGRRSAGGRANAALAAGGPPGPGAWDLERRHGAQVEDLPVQDTTHHGHPQASTEARRTRKPLQTKEIFTSHDAHARTHITRAHPPHSSRIRRTGQACFFTGPWEDRDPIPLFLGLGDY